MMELQIFIESNDIDIIAITESLCKNPTEGYDPVFILKGYDCVANNKGRGTLLFIKNTLEYITLSQYEDVFSPSTICKISIDKSSDIILGVIYRSPSSTEEDSQKLNNLIDQISEKYCKKNIVLVGDFNYKEIDWKKDMCEKNDSHIASKFLECIHRNYLEQLIEEDTHHRGDQTPSLIDLILTNQKEIVEEIVYQPPLGKSHHTMICFNLNVVLNTESKEKVEKYRLDKGDFDGMREYISKVEWNEKLKDTDNLNEWASNFNHIIEEAKTKFIPMKSFNPNKPIRKFAAPITLLEALQMKRKAFKKKKKYNTPKNNEEYIYYRNLVNKEVKRAKRAKEQKVAKEAKVNPKVLYQYFSSMCKQKESVPNLERPDGTITDTDTEKAQVLSNFFKSVYVKEGGEPMPEFKANVKNKIKTIIITEEGVRNALRELNVNKSQGPDGMHPRVLKELADQIAFPLYKIFTRSITEGKIPDIWREAEVRPIFKKGKKTDPGNYRPVSLTSVLCKLLEGFVRSALYKHIVENDLLSEHQFGFCKGRSCLTQLLVTINEWMTYLDQNIPVDVAYLDFKKAFDSVPHKRLIHKMKGYGVEGNLLDWVTDFLKDRTQFVSVNGCNSESVPVTSGVPQGSVLGPTLFIYYINDLPTVTDSKSKIFADDTKGFNPIRNQDDHKKQQECIDSFVKWSVKWLLGFNTTKCNMMHLGKNNPRHKYTINNGDEVCDLNITICEKDLGVYIDPLLDFNEHMAKTVKKARSIAGMILRNINGRTYDILVPLFVGLVRPILEYANPVWSPIYRKDIDMIEKVQRNFTKRVSGLNRLTYSERLRRLDLPSLEFRRARGDMVETFKIMKGMYDESTTKTLVIRNSNSITRNNNNNHTRKHDQYAKRIESAHPPAKKESNETHIPLQNCRGAYTSSSTRCIPPTNETEKTY